MQKSSMISACWPAMDSAQDLLDDLLVTSSGRLDQSPPALAVCSRCRVRPLEQQPGSVEGDEVGFDPLHWEK